MPPLVELAWQVQARAHDPALCRWNRAGGPAWRPERIPGRACVGGWRRGAGHAPFAGLPNNHEQLHDCGGVPAWLAEISVAALKRRQPHQHGPASEWIGSVSPVNEATPATQTTAGRRRPGRAGSALLIGHPTRPPPELPKLPRALSEMHALDGASAAATSTTPAALSWLPGVAAGG